MVGARRGGLHPYRYGEQARPETIVASARRQGSHGLVGSPTAADSATPEAADLSSRRLQRPLRRSKEG
jgi:hypothetical protein